MTGRVQSLRSSTAGQRPATATRAAGELYTNWPDRQIGVIDASQAAMDLVAVRFFSTTANYVTGDFVVQGGEIYQAKSAVTAGAFNPSQWSQVIGAGDAASFSTLSVAGTATFSAVTSVTATDANAFDVGRSGTTNPALRVDTSVASSVTGLRILSEPAGSGLQLQTLSSATNENVILDAKGSGIAYLNPTGTGGVNLAAGGGTTTVSGGLTANGAGAQISLQPSGSGQVTIRPATLGTINNMQIGASVASTGNFTGITGSLASSVVGFMGASYAFVGWNKNDTTNAGGIEGVTGSAGTTYGILGFNSGSALYSFYGSGQLYNSGAAVVAGTFQATGNATFGGALTVTNNIQTTSGSIYLQGSLNFTAISSFVVGYGGGANLTTGTGVFDIMFGGTSYYRFQASNGYPNFDSGTNWGVSSNRWLAIYAATGTIQTSDEREKQDIRPMADKEKAVGLRLKDLLVMYRWKENAAKTIDTTRLYAGIIAQRVEEAFAAEGLDPEDYAVWSKDPLGEYEHADGEEPVFVPNGQFRYSIDYNQVFALILAAL